MIWNPTHTNTANPIALLLLAAGLFVTLSTGLVVLREYRDHTTERHGDLKIAAQMLASTIAEPAAAGNTSAIRQALRSVGREPDLESIVVVGAGGEILAETSARIFSVTEPGLGGDWVLPFDLLKDRPFTVEVPLRHVGQIVGTLRMTARGGTLGARFAGHLVDALLAALFAALAGVAVSDRLRKRTQSPDIEPTQDADARVHPVTDESTPPAAPVLALPAPDSSSVPCNAHHKSDTVIRLVANADRRSPEPKSQSATGSARALLVGFSAEDASDLARALDRIHIRSNVSSTGRSACNRALTGTYDLLFVECRGDQSPGKALIQDIRRSESHQGQNCLPIVAALDDISWTRSKPWLDAGADECLALPVRMPALAVITMRWIGSDAAPGQEHGSNQNRLPKSNAEETLRLPRELERLPILDFNRIGQMTDPHLNDHAAQCFVHGMTMFEANIPTAMESLRHAITRNDGEAVKTIASTMQAMATEAGAVRLSRISAALAGNSDRLSKAESNRLYRLCVQEMAVAISALSRQRQNLQIRRSVALDAG